jgi:hypothetical protein
MRNSKLRTVAWRALCALFAFLAAQVATAAWPGPVTSALWTLQATDGKIRWLEIHNLSTARLDGAYHVQILERRRTDPPSTFVSLADHLAITEAALRASIVAPRNSGSVYPERFQAAYAQWQAARAAGTAAICETNVTACLAGSVN